MSNTKTGLMFSELTERVYWGKINTKTGISHGDKKDITSEFIGIMTQKFPINTIQEIECNGVVESAFIHVDNEKVSRYRASKEMYEMLELAISLMDGDSIEDFTYQYNEIKQLLAKARGELC